MTARDRGGGGSLPLVGSVPWSPRPARGVAFLSSRTQEAPSVGRAHGRTWERMLTAGAQTRGAGSSHAPRRSRSCFSGGRSVPRWRSDTRLDVGLAVLGVEPAFLLPHNCGTSERRRLSLSPRFQTSLSVCTATAPPSPLEIRSVLSAPSPLSFQHNAACRVAFPTLMKWGHQI